MFHTVDIPNSWGIFPRVALHLILHKSKNNSHGITATAVEIYMDNCYDLMREKQKIAVEGFGRSRKVSGRGSFLETCEVKRDASGKWVPPRTLVEKEGYGMRGAKSTILSDVNSLLDFMRIVEATRTSKSHKLNERSSRSHCVITLSIPSISNAKYMLVDLAGSERIMKSGTIKCEMKAAEARNINTSLTSLGRCITALANCSFVPYRDSVLTMLLKQSLGGRCVTSVIITGTEDEEMHGETMASIKFGIRCSKVVNKNEHEAICSSNNSDEMKSNLMAQLQSVDKELQAIIDSGRAGGINTEFPKSLQQSFMINMEKFKHHKSHLISCTQKLKAGSAKAGLQKSKRYEESQVKNLQGILVRSMTTGVYTDPCPSYMKNVQRRIDIVSTLRGMGANIDSMTDVEIPMTLDHLLLGFEG